MSAKAALIISKIMAANGESNNRGQRRRKQSMKANGVIENNGMIMA